ncbi:MAG TPA: DUF3016 domain-containing protein [Telluria sp.]
MKPMIRKLALAGATALVSLGAMAGQAVVTFTHPENYSDFPVYDADRDDLLKEMADHFIKQAARLPASQELKVEVLDINLAGDVRPGFRFRRDIRILRGRADWPTMVVRYTLRDNGQVVRSGEEQLSDMAYLQHGNRYYPDDPLRYEKSMVDGWMSKRFGLPR